EKAKKHISDKVNVELEARVRDATPEIFNCVYNKANADMKFLLFEQSLSCISRDIFTGDTTKQYIRKQVFGDGQKKSDEYSSKQRIGGMTVNSHMKYIIAVSVESPEEPFNVAPNALLRFKNRMSF